MCDRREVFSLSKVPGGPSYPLQCILGILWGSLISHSTDKDIVGPKAQNIMHGLGCTVQELL
jgi:hypothetical protein